MSGLKYPRARQRPLPERGTQRTITPTQLVFHSAVGRSSIWGYLARKNVVVESTWWIGLAADQGGVEQYMDTDEKAEAQWLGNPRALSVETADNGHPDAFPWTAYQVEELAQLAAWCHRELGIPLRLCRSYTDPGIGYHRLFKEWNPNSHSCPGTARIAQVEQILARARQIVAGVSPAAPAPVEDDMQLTDPIPLGKGNRANLSTATGKPAPPVFTVGDALSLGVLNGARLANLERTVTQLAGQLAGLTAAIKAGGGNLDVPAIEAAVRRAIDGAEATVRLDTTPGA